MARNSSLELLIEINQSEREAQLSHFDSLDTKSGLVLGFAGVLIALGNGTGTLAGTGSTAFAAIAALAAVSSFWPRRFPSVDPTRLGEYAVSELSFTQLTILDTFELMLVETTQRLETKARRLKLALLSLSTAAVLAALDLVFG
jgi:hypothetical protein